jgi:hypothetical protein
MRGGCKEFGCRRGATLPRTPCGTVASMLQLAAWKPTGAGDLPSSSVIGSGARSWPSVCNGVAAEPQQRCGNESTPRQACPRQAWKWGLPNWTGRD